MFKRPKEPSKQGAEGNRSASRSPAPRLQNDPAAAEAALKPATATNPPHIPAEDNRSKITPVYDSKKPQVRTLKSTAHDEQKPARANAANLHVGRGLKLEGKIQSCDSLVVEGDVEATIDSGSLTITESGVVKGKADVTNAEIDGHFEGELKVAECLTVTQSGRITGAVTYGELKVERGGKISGDVNAADLPGLKAANDKGEKARSSTAEQPAQAAARAAE